MKGVLSEQIILVSTGQTLLISSYTYTASFWVCKQPSSSLKVGVEYNRLRRTGTVVLNYLWSFDGHPSRAFLRKCLRMWSAKHLNSIRRYRILQSCNHLSVIQQGISKGPSKLKRETWDWFGGSWKSGRIGRELRSVGHYYGSTRLPETSPGHSGWGDWSYVTLGRLITG